MSDDSTRAHIRILPTADEQAPEVPTPDATEIQEEAPDTGQLLDKVIDSKSWPPGAVVGDGTPGPGRPKLDIDERIVKAMAMVGGGNKEIAEFFDCDVKVIERRFGHILKAARAGRKLRLRQAQYQLAVAGNPTMLIWLGKQELGQFDETRMRVGDLNRYTDEELALLAQGKVPGQLGSGKDSADAEEK